MSSTTRHRLNSSRGPKRFHLLELAPSLTSRSRILNQIQLIASTNEHSNIMFDTSLSCFKKEQTSKTVLRKEFQQLRERYNSYFEAYTDGSKSEHKVEAAAFFTKDPDNPKITRLRDGSSVFNAELEGILLSLQNFLALSQPKNFIIYTDSLSAVESLRCKTFKTKNVKRFYNLLKKIPPQTQMVIA